MIPSSQTAARGFVLRKVAGRFDACRQLVSSTGHRISHPSLLGTLGAFVLMILPLLAVLAIVAIALHDMTSAVTGVGILKATGLLTGKQLREKRATLANEANEILKRSTAGLTPEDEQTFNRIHVDIEKIGTQIDSIEKHERVMAHLAQPVPKIAGGADSSEEEQRGEITEKVAAYKDAFETYVRYGKDELTPEQRVLLRSGFRREEGGPVNAGNRAQTVSTTGGGYLIPQGFQAELEANMKLFGGVEGACRVIETPTGNPLPWPTRDDTGNTGRLLAINTGATTTDLVYGVKTLNAYKFSSDVVLVPVELLQDSAIDINTEVGAALGERIGRVHNTYQTTGTGSAQPQGIVVGSSAGVTAAGTSTVTPDELLDLIHTIDPAYRNPIFGAGFMFNDGTLKKLKQMKDGEGRPIWQAGIAGEAPNTIHGYPYTINQDMAAMTTGLKPVLFGALKKFIVRKVKGFTLLRLEERYADSHQVGFLAFTRMDSIFLDSGAQDPGKYITMA